jgi:hypothetical protein
MEDTHDLHDLGPYPDVVRESFLEATDAASPQTLAMIADTVQSAGAGDSAARSLFM